MLEQFFGELNKLAKVSHDAGNTDKHNHHQNDDAA